MRTDARHGSTVMALLLAGGLLAAGWVAPRLADAQANPQNAAVCTGTADDRACIDWTRGVAIAYGTGAPSSSATNPAARDISAQRAAQLDAGRNLLQLIKGVNLTSDTTLQQASVANDSVRSTVEGSLNSFRQVGRAKYFSNGTVEIKMEASLRQIIPSDLYLGPPTEVGSQAGTMPQASGITPGAAYTGLIIDGRGTGLTPAMSPKVYDPDGKEVYGSSYVTREFAISQGIAGYVKSIDQAKGTTDRIGANPVIVKAQTSKGANKADIVLSKEDSDQLRTLSQQQTFLREARVMIVLD